ncbi:docking domain of Afi1 for Arf3 in vesicle trafficking-domain-containing protein [Peziza echinospora]|nr:docking domain of Afi1 for Arf3 in vesicle trafficking-domain-containing protein [Peziza echinospora]
MSTHGSVQGGPSRTASVASNPSVTSSGRGRSGSVGSVGSVGSLGSVGSVGSVTSRISSDSKEGELCHVEYILVAEFEVDQGPLMEHQYPNAISGDEHMLAELMLPDQAHLYEQDWTVFFLHRDAEQLEGKHFDPTGQPPLIYVLNLVITKHDATVKRGAKVKAMAICTRHPFLHIYKPILLLALEEYFKFPVTETLEKLYTAVNEMDLSYMPHLSVLESQILASSDNKEMFSEKFEEMINNPVIPQRSPSAASHLYNGDGLMMKSNGDGPKKAATYIDLSSGRRNGLFALNRDTHEFESRVVYNGIPIPVKIPVAILPETVGDFSLIQLITTFSTPHSQTPQPFPLHPHLTTNGPYTHPIIVLVNALLTQKRVVFLGKGKPSGEVVDHVLAACALASGGTLRGFTRHAFPYTDLSKVDELLRVPGFIAGVKNPAFANHDDWWDILCNIDTGRIKISPSIKQPQPSDLLKTTFNFTGTNIPDTGDNAFMDDVLHCIASRFGENAVRARWRDWIIRFTRMAAAFEEVVYGVSALWIGREDSLAVKGHGYVWPDENTKMRDLQANASRIEGWCNTRSYYAYVQDLGNLYTAKPIKSLDLHHQLDRLRTLRLSHFASSEIFHALHAATTSNEAVNQVLCCIPEYQGGVFPIAVGLFHPYQKTRFATVEILERLRDHMAGRHFFNSMNRFQKLAFVRLKGERDIFVAQQQQAGVGLGLAMEAAVNAGGSPILGVNGK